MIVKKRRTLLLVEDELLIAFAKQKELEKYGYDVLTANTGEKAVTMSKENDGIDLILMDIDLGRGIDGTEAAGIILRDRGLPVVFLSSHTEPGMVEKTEKITSYGYVVKSSSITVLDASIKMAFKLNEAHKKLQKSEQKYHQVVSNIPNIIWSAYVGPDGNLVNAYISDVADNLLKLPKGTINNSMEKYFSYIKSEYLRKIQETINKGTQSLGTVLDVEYEMIRDDGETICVNTTASCSMEGGRLKIFGSTLDITEKKKSQEYAYSLSRRNKAIIESVPDIIMEVDADKVYTWTNNTGYEFFGDDVIGKEASFYFEGEQKTYEAVSPIFKGSEDIIYVESWQRRKDGEKRLLAWWCKVIKDIKGNVTGILSTARDITERKQVEIAISEANTVQ